VPATSSTIAAIASGTGGGIGTIRISGPAAESIGRTLFPSWPAEVQSHHLYLGHIETDAEQVDQVLACLMRAPRSYTGEDVLEIHGHGGAINLRRILDACLLAGARPAAPGEFTRRAFLAGKLDLTSAEAVAELISAHSVEAARQAQRHLCGELGQRIAELRRRVVSLLGDCEGMLDFPDLEVDAAMIVRLTPKLRELFARLSELAESFTYGGKALSNGIELGLLGRTNVGKSSLVNALCQAERVLVDAQPGTTRDYVETRGEWQGVPVTLVDTAGEREDATAVEAEGLRLGRERWRRVDLLLLVVDGTVGIGAAEKQLLATRPPSLPYLIVWNKIDRVGCLPPPEGAIGCSALCGWGMSSLRQEILNRLAPQLERDGELLVTSARQATLLFAAAEATSRAAACLENDAVLEVVASELRVAASRLGELTGDEVSEGVLDAIFSQFCVGK
jgi:tRNA modification GTPase